MYYDTEPDYDWVYFCISTDHLNYNCDYWSGYSFWADHSYWLTYYAGYSQVWFAWVFYSDSSISDGYFGPYIDDIYIWGNDSPPTPPVESLRSGRPTHSELRLRNGRCHQLEYL